MTRTIPPLVLALALAGCVPAQQYAVPPVPPPQVEVMPRPPIADTALIWRPGDWEWTGSGYAWRPGAYEPAGGHSSNWLPGHWEGAGSSYAWVPGHWL